MRSVISVSLNKDVYLSLSGRLKNSILVFAIVYIHADVGKMVYF